MAFQNVNYQPIQSDNEELGEDLPPTVVTTRGSENSGRWNHIENLDDFFTRIYEYHQNQGFTCMLLSELLELVQYVFIVMFTTFLIICLDYKALFKDPSPTWSKVVHLHKFNRMPAGMVICLCVAFFFWTVRLLRVIKHLCKAWQIREFYYTALNISNNELQNMQWHEVQRKLIEVQKIHHMCVHKAELTELDIYNRILRRKNYLIAMLNKAVIPCIYRFPFLGHRTFLTHGLKYNLKLILFSGPGSPFQTNWKLKPEYKDNVQKRSLANSLSRRIFLLGIANLVLCPFILIYQILYSFFRYAEIVKRAPDFFGSRMWSSYGRLYLRHFNELDHQFQARLSKAYEPATKYMNSFVSPLATVIAKNIAFFAGAMLAVLLAFSFYDQDVLKAEHVISTMAALGMIIKGCTAFIPEENFLWCPEQYMKEVLTHTHYIPDHWKGKAHTSDVREQFSRLFQYKMRFAQLLAPETNHVTSNLKVEVTGVGDVCSFAQLDVRRHGNPSWLSKGVTEANQYEQAENGKTELSLLHFSMRNPTWRPTESGERFITTIKEQAMRDSLSMSGSLPYQSGSWNQTAVSSQAPPDLTTFIGPLHYPSLYPSLDPRVEANQRDIVMNTSMMYMHEMRDRAATRSDPVLPRPDQGQSAHGEFPRTWPRYEGLGDQDDDDLLQATEPIGSMTGSAESKF